MSTFHFFLSDLLLSHHVEKTILIWKKKTFLLYFCKAVRAFFATCSVTGDPCLILIWIPDNWMKVYNRSIWPTGSYVSLRTSTMLAYNSIRLLGVALIIVNYFTWAEARANQLTDFKIMVLLFRWRKHISLISLLYFLFIIHLIHHLFLFEKRR